MQPIGMMKMQCVTIYPNIYECVPDFMKIHHERFWTFYGYFSNEARELRSNKTQLEQFPRNTLIFQNSIWMIPNSFRQKRLMCRSASDCSRFLNCLSRKQSEKYSAKWDRGLIWDHVGMRHLVQRKFANWLYVDSTKGTNQRGCEIVWPTFVFIILSGQR